MLQNAVSSPASLPAPSPAAPALPELPGLPEPPAPPLFAAAAPRDDLIDALRGIALLGIALVNAPAILIASAGFNDASLASTLDRAVGFAAIALIQSKFYLIFAFLFGYSLPYTLQNKGLGPQPRFRKRLAALAVLGLLHGVFLFSGDILLLYAAVGAVMLLVVGRSDRVVIAVAALATLLWGWALAGRLLAGTADDATQHAFQLQMAAIDAQLAGGTFWQAARARLELSPIVQSATFVFYGLAVLAAFCIGLIGGRRQWLRSPAQHMGRWRRGLVWGLVLGLPGALLSAWWLVGPGLSFTSPGPMQILALTIGLASAPALSCTYVSALALRQPRRPARLALFEAAGRMSLSFYLASSLLMALLACGFGLGLMGRFGAAAVAGMAVGVWLLLALLARGWLRRFKRGPVEHLLHRWTRAGESRSPAFTGTREDPSVSAASSHSVERKATVNTAQAD